MKVFAVASVLSVMLAVTSIHAQAPSQARPAPATQRAPAAPAPAAAQQPRPAAPTAPAPAPPPAPVPHFQDGLKYAYINVQQVAALSQEGRLANEKVKALNDQKVRELNEKNKALQGVQQKLEQGGNVLSDAARAQLQSEIERQQRDIQRFTEDAQQDVTALQQQLQEEFQRKLNPVLDKVAREKQVHMVFSAADSGLVWADPGLDLTAEVIRAFDGPGAKPAAAAPVVPPPAAAAPVAPAPAAPAPAAAPR